MTRTSMIADQTDKPSGAMENYRATWNRFTRWLVAGDATVRPQAEALPEIAEEATAEQDLDHAIATIRAIYGQDFGAGRLAREVTRNRNR